ncbi:MAG: hypothetical protein ACRC62_35520 [Microcoleus sp.]
MRQRGAIEHSLQKLDTDVAGWLEMASLRAAATALFFYEKK